MKFTAQISLVFKLVKQIFKASWFESDFNASSASNIATLKKIILLILRLANFFPP